MADVFRQITLNEKGTNAGPYFDVYYSADCSTYTLATDGGGVYLPTIGSTAVVTIPDSSQCLKLVNLTEICGNNFVVENIGLTTTTTTTTTSTSTTSTTTTAGPTTTTSTTTTLAPKFWNAIYCNNGAAVGVPLKMAGTATTGSVVEAGTGVDTCATLTTVYTSTPIVFFDRTSATIYASCTACGITTTTTTTLPPVWYNLYNCSNGNTETSAQYPAGTFSVNQRVVYGGSLYFYVLSSTTTDPGGIQWSISSAGAGLTGCPATTTTTTTTTLAPITLTVSGSCAGGFGTGQILANNFAGSTGTYNWIASGSTETNAILAVGGFVGTRFALSGATSYNFTNLANGNYWVAILDSDNRTGLSSMVAIDCGTTTTTTTTTLAPGYFRALDCRDNVTHIYSTLQPDGTFSSGQRITANGGVNYVVDGFTTSNPGGTLYTFTATGLFGCPTTTTSTTTTLAPLTVTNGTVTCSGVTGAWRSSFTGGSGTYTNVAYGTSEANAIDWLDGSGTGTGAMHTLTAGDTYYDWSGIGNGTWYVALKDSTPSTTVQTTPVVVNCTTTTLAPTTTTTTLQPVWYNLFNCYDGSSTTSAQYTIGTFSVGQRVAYGTGPSILYFNVVSEVTTNPGGIQWSVYGTGDTGCPATTTTTTTTTLAPVDFTYSTQCSGGQGYVTFTGLSGGASGGTYEYSTNYGVNYYTATVGLQIGPFANGTSAVIIVRNTLGGSTSKTTPTFSCATTTTTTTTAAPATTTTTTAAPGGTAYVSIQNNFTAGTITDVTVNGVSISGASFPLAVGDSTSGITTQIGTNETIRVYFSSVSPSPSYITVTGTDFTEQCELAAGTTNRLYTNVVIAADGVVGIYGAEGNCP